MAERGKKLIDPRFIEWAQCWLEDASIPDRVIERHVRFLAEDLADAAETYLDDLPRLEHERDEMLRDAYEQRRIDEARGK